jgi:DNA-directed RNA polymerase subunit RPC12/RpoP
MAVLFDNLKVGGWYAIFEHKEQEAEPNPYDAFNLFARAPKRQRCDGMPFMIRAASFPFITGVGLKGEFLAFDFREVQFVSLDKRYVNEWYKAVASASGQLPQGQSCLDVARKHLRKLKKKKEKPDPNTCPRCGSRMIQKLRDVKDGWRIACRDCGMDAGPAPKA